MISRHQLTPHYRYGIPGVRVAGVAVAVVVAMGAVAVVPAVGQPPAGREQTRAPVETVSDPDDFYYYQGKPVHLARSQSEIVLGIGPGADEKRVLQKTAAPVTVGTAIQHKGRRFHIITLDNPSPGALKRLVESVRSMPEVWFVAHVYYHPADMVRVVPTDEIVVKVNPGITEDGITDVLKTHGLRIDSRLAGTTDEYLLRLTPAKSLDVLRVSRDLHEIGLFLWAEPNFIQELRRTR